MEQSNLVQTSSGIYYLPCGENDRPSLGIIIGKNATALVDAGNSPEHAKLLLNEISKLPFEIPPIKYICITHWHWDHIFGLAAFSKDVKIIAQQQTIEKILEMQEYRWDDLSLAQRVAEGTEIVFSEENIKLEYPDTNRQIQVIVPNVSFESTYNLDLGNTQCILQHVGGDHSPDSTIIAVNNVIFLGDAIYPNVYSQEEVTGDLLHLLEDLLASDCDTYIESHDKHFSRTTLNEMYDLFKLIYEIVKSTPNLDEIQAAVEASNPIETLRISLSWEKDDISYFAEAFFKGLS
ncbi:MBL fold metallo-hydrolase [Candidatus Lokiarchaeum ossiferum]|uniref:MBL fold metallo-hydrolase n=1 Tax=Candidatus Lokiarchaeum ossiferum TaxID=2951803 RepID=UPI00352EFA0C